MGISSSTGGQGNSSIDIMHRVIDTMDISGTTYFITKGDAK
ncbi:MAG: hypothetical protein TUN42_04520 [Dehalogenimonas sp.]